MPSVKEITDLMESPSKTDIDLITKAYNFSEDIHKDHLRLSGDPFFVHPFETAKTLAILGMGANTIAAGLLHDALEDATVTEKDIEREFGREVLFLVEGVTKLGAIKYRGEKRHIESLRKFFVAVSQDIRVLIIKLSDRLHNMRTLEFQKKEKRYRIALETLEIYAPLAYRLGMRKINRELEDLAFPYIYPKEHAQLLKLLKRKSKIDIKHLEKFYRSLKKTLAKDGIIHVTSDYRLKSLYSLYKKLERYGGDLEKIYDLAALRVIVPTVGDCYKILGIIHGMWRPLPGRIKDYIAFPKPNGYQSLHTTIFTGDGGIIEVQIRTKEMHKSAEYGIASHIGYKDGYKKLTSPDLLWIRNLLPDKVNFDNKSSFEAMRNKDIPQWVKELADFQTEATGKKGFLQNLKSDFFEQRVFIFTPKGDVVDLPIGSSPIDFAYAIHSDIGNHVFGAKVNGKLVSLDTSLKNGDIVEIITKKTSKPSHKWLAFVKTTLAKKNIEMANEAKREARR